MGECAERNDINRDILECKYVHESIISRRIDQY